MAILDRLFGKPLASSEEPEAALTLLIPLGALSVGYIGPISAIIVLLIIVYPSYRQTIGAYPNGGGSYTVAHENLGTFPGLLAAAALLLDRRAIGTHSALHYTSGI